MNPDSAPHPPPISPGWYPDPLNEADVCFWDGSRWTGERARREAGWYEQSPGVRNYWNGRRWTWNKTSRANRRVVLATLVIAAAGIAMLVWFRRRLDNTLLYNYRPGQMNYVCFKATDEELIGSLWLPWTMLASLSGAQIVTWFSGGRHDWRVWLPTVASVVSVLVTWPPFNKSLGLFGCDLM